MTLLAPAVRTPDTDAAIDRMHAIDLTMVRMKLCKPEPGAGDAWTAEMAIEVEKEYRRFLALVSVYPENSIVPSRTIDTFWHQHILDTQAYESDCNRIFGRFIHHNPYFGVGGEKEQIELHAAYETTLALYFDSFGEPPSAYWGHPTSNASDCSTPTECSGGPTPGGCTARCTGLT